MSRREAYMDRMWRVIGARSIFSRPGVVMRVPTRDEIQPIAKEQAVVEFYSR